MVRQECGPSVGACIPVSLFERKGRIYVWVGVMNGEAKRPTQLRRKVGCAELAAIPEVRRALRAMLRHWGGPGASDVAELLTSELVTNALIHTDRGAVVTATVVPDDVDTLRVEVRDFVPELPEPYVPHADAGTRGSIGPGSQGVHGSQGAQGLPGAHEATHGRGLFLVEALADAWGIQVQGSGTPGKVVWFELNGGAA